MFNLSSYDFGKLVDTQKTFEAVMESFLKMQKKQNPVKEKVIWVRYNAQDLGV